jgi:hypothetical protein
MSGITFGGGGCGGACCCIGISEGQADQVDFLIIKTFKLNY